ncbi:MAG: hypothetical protein ABWY71_01960, partial [Candidatus Saccharimonadales bacterium]
GACYKARKQDDNLEGRIDRLENKIDAFDKKIDDAGIRLEAKIDDLREELRNVEIRLDSKVDSLSAAVAEALDASHDEVEARLTRLKHKTA